jgi:hypothetical protein
VATWHTPGTARTEWSDAPKDDTQLAGLLTAARHQCEAFAPIAKTADPTAIPEEFRIAHLMQARAIWQAQNTATNPAGDFEAGGQTVRVYPMDWQVKSLLRPAVGVPGIG